MNMKAMGDVNRLCIHHSAGASGSAEEFREEHRAKGWADIGYHAVIGNGKGDVDGHVAPGRPEEFEGAGVWGNNEGTLHVCLVGNFQEDHPSQEQIRSLGHWLLNRMRRYGAQSIVGHNEMSVTGHHTACPGNWFLAAQTRNNRWRSCSRLDAVREWCKERRVGSFKQELDQFLANEGLL